MSLPVTNITSHLWTNRNTFSNTSTTRWLLFWKGSPETSHISARSSLIRALSLHPAPATLEAHWLVREVDASADRWSVFVWRCDLILLRKVGSMRMLVIIIFMNSFSVTEWCTVERIALGIKLGLRAGMARQVFQRSGRDCFLLSWCRYPRWARLEHDGGKKETFVLSSPGGAALSELDTSPQNR